MLTLVVGIVFAVILIVLAVTGMISNEREDE